MPRAKKPVVQAVMSVPKHVGHAVLGGDDAAAALKRQQECYANLVQERATVQKYLDNNPVAPVIAKGLLGVPARIEVTMQGEMVVLPAETAKRVRKLSKKVAAGKKVADQKKTVRRRRTTSKKQVAAIKKTAQSRVKKMGLVVAGLAVTDAVAAQKKTAPTRASKKKTTPKKTATPKKTVAKAKKGNGVAKKKSTMPKFPSITELRAQAEKAGADISKIAPQNKRAILDAIENHQANAAS